MVSAGPAVLLAYAGIGVMPVIIMRWDSEESPGVSKALLAADTAASTSDGSTGGAQAFYMPRNTSVQAVVHVFAVLRLLSMTDREKDVEILALRH